MNIESILFHLLGFVALASTYYVAVSKNLVRSVFMFFVTLFALAGLYVFALADFVAVTQIVVYVGGVLVLMLFAFMLTNKDTLNNLQQLNKGFVTVKRLPALLVAALFFVVISNAIIKAKPDEQGWIKASVQNHNIILPTDETVNNIGVNLMTRYLLPFEVVSIVLLMALIGAAHLARKEEHKL